MTNVSDKSRKPDYRLKILNKVSSSRCSDAGAAWLNADGSLSLKINPGVHLKDDADLVYTLFTGYEGGKE